MTVHSTLCLVLCNGKLVGVEQLQWHGLAWLLLWRKCPASRIFVSARWPYIHTQLANRISMMRLLTELPNESPHTHYLCISLFYDAVSAVEVMYLTQNDKVIMNCKLERIKPPDTGYHLYHFFSTDDQHTLQWMTI